MKSASLSCLISGICVLFFSGAWGQDTYTCVTNLENGTATCSPQLSSLTRALQDKQYALANWSTVQQELMGLLDSSSQNYNPFAALSAAGLLTDHVTAYTQDTKLEDSKASPIVKQLLNIMLTILVKGLHRPGHEGGKRTVQEYADDLFSLYLLAKKYDFNSLTGGGQNQLQEPPPPKNRSLQETRAYEKAKTAYDDAQKLLKLLTALTKDNFTLNDLYGVYGRRFLFTKRQGEDTPSLDGRRCNFTLDQEYRYEIVPQFILFERTTIIEDLVNLYRAYKDQYEFGEVYKQLETHYNELVNSGRNYAAYYTPEESVQIANMLGVDLEGRKWPIDCSYSFGDAVRLYNKLIDVHGIIANKLKIEKLTQADSATDPLNYVTSSSIKEALSLAPNTLCSQMGACVVDAQGHTTNLYQGQDPDRVILKLVGEKAV